MKKNTLPNFSVEYYCDHNDFLRGIFWADNISKLNYKEFGDIVGFDATYGTNMYNMVFVPLTGVDNHKKLVIFGAALLASESIESFSWFLDCFLKVFVTEPGLVSTDQDPAMLEVGRELFSNKDFHKQMNNIFWNQELNAEKFEKCWQHVLDEFGLHDVDWFKDMHAMKEKWIPFEKQCHNNTVLEFEMDNRFINCVTNKLIELHARDFYTPTMFLLVQEEIFQSSISWVQISSTIEENEDKQLCVIEEKFPLPRLNWKYRVTFDVKTTEASCSCLLFTHEGRLCRHIFYVYHVHDVVAIPMIINHVFNKLRKVSSLYQDDLDKLVSFRDKFDVLICNFLGSTSDEPSTSTRGEHINRLWGLSKPVNSNIRAPENIRNKGQRRSDRILSSKEVAVKKHVKTRACKRCGIHGQNVRTCTTDLTQLHNSKNKGKNVIDFELEDESEEDDEDLAYGDEDSDSD
ncbi:protein FAR1-RELATED SEQUENCE 7-like [Rutidosis leptorrhynchoides]|uniref:protein FAR1-RELATED SEQUENCE 7-like n=1 Tax=Rutidosis leptorrhynchoides TaxID=125765 RepID=UPI003A9A0362